MIPSLINKENTQSFKKALIIAGRTKSCYLSFDQFYIKISIVISLTVTLHTFCAFLSFWSIVQTAQIYQLIAGMWYEKELLKEFSIPVPRSKHTHMYVLDCVK